MNLATPGQYLMIVGHLARCWHADGGGSGDHALYWVGPAPACDPSPTVTTRFNGAMVPDAREARTYDDDPERRSIRWVDESAAQLSETSLLPHQRSDNPTTFFAGASGTTG